MKTRGFEIALLLSLTATSGLATKVSTETPQASSSFVSCHSTVGSVGAGQDKDKEKGFDKGKDKGNDKNEHNANDKTGGGGGDTRTLGGRRD